MQLNKINWTNTLFLTLTPLVGIGGLVTLCLLGLFVWQTALLAIIWAFIGGICITAGYHRLFSHKSYEAKLPLRIFFLLFGTAAFEGSVLEWCTDHRNHHRYTDTKKDPYNFQQGFWYAHILWLIRLNPKLRNYSNVNDLTQDRLIMLQHRFFAPLAIFMGFIVPALIAACWGDLIGGLVIAGALTITIQQHFTFLINSASHAFGKQPYTSLNSSRDNWVLALFTFGEGFHNFHHKFPIDYRNGIRFYHYDPTKWFIKGLSYLGLTTNLQRVNQQRIMKLKIEKAHIKANTLLAMSSYQLKDNLQNKLHNLYQSVLQRLTKFEKIQQRYYSLKNTKMDNLHEQLVSYNARLKYYRRQLRQLRAELKKELKNWSQLNFYIGSVA